MFKEKFDKNSTIGILYSLYEDSTLFSTNTNHVFESSVRQIVVTRVIAATVGFDLNLTDLYPPIVITLDPRKEIEEFMVSLHVILKYLFLAT